MWAWSQWDGDRGWKALCQGIGEGVLDSSTSKIWLIHKFKKIFKNLLVDPIAYLSVSQSVVYRPFA